MNYESNRLSTFSNWPTNAEIDPIRIAKAGFFFTGRGMEVQCFSCGGKISEWHSGDQVMSRHRRLDPSCPFVVNPSMSGNVALILDPHCIDQSTPESRTNALSDSSNLVHDSGESEDDELYKSEPLRVLSFVNWNDNSVSREELVRAGFYHLGEGKIRCAWCGGEIARMRRLGVLGTPLEIHQRYFPTCSHARQVAARDAAARAEFPAPLAAPPAAPPAAPRSPRTPPGAPAGLFASPPVTPEQPSAQSQGAIHNQRVLTGGGTWRALGVVGGAGGARHPDRASLAARLESYRGWPARGQSPQDMAEAGFSYTGCEDQVRCFYCDGGLGKWEAGDAPWREHARWFPHCGYLLLMKGAAFVKECMESPETRSAASEASLSSRRLNPSCPVNVGYSESQVTEQMESSIAASALGAGLDAARVRRAIVRRLRATGLPFSSSEALIDAVLDEQLNEEAWSVSPHTQRFARDILAETLREFVPATASDRQSNSEHRSDSRDRLSNTLPDPTPTIYNSPVTNNSTVVPNHSNQTKVTVKEEIERVAVKGGESPSPETRLLKEENRQLREARQCKVCMDGEVSVVFLPCGHLVSCAMCGAGLGACPLCRAHVQALVRAYLA